MAEVFCWSSVILVFACAVLHITRRKKLACWLLAVFPAALCLGLAFDLAHGAAKLGQAGYSSDVSTLPYLLAFLVITLVAAFRQQSRWIFWIAWVFSAFISAVVVFLTYFWKVFS